MVAPGTAPSERKLELAYLQRNRDYFRTRCLNIVTKSKGLQPLVLNYTQRTIVAKIAELRSRGIAPRIVVLKSRQVGVSTITGALFFEDSFLVPFRTNLVIADTIEHTKGLFRMQRRFARFLPKDLQFKKRFDNVREMEFPNDSRLQVEPEGEVRSMTANGLHLSEFAFFEHPRETLTAALQTMPNSPDTLAVMESTANGEGNMFHEIFVRAMQRSRDKDVPLWERGWFPIFIPWWRHEEYRMTPWFDERDLTKEERELMQQFALHPSQIAWRRWAIENNCNGDVDKFRVEYPATWEEAFALSGRPIFTREQLSHYRVALPPQPDPGKTVWEQTPESEVEWDQSKNVAIIVPQDGGRLRVFRAPHPRHLYVLFADPSEGDKKSDPSPIEVLDLMTFEQSAEWWGRTPPEVLAKYSAWLGWYYNTALVNAEANNQGILYFATLLEMGYPNIYYRSTSEETVAGEVTDKPGLFQTNKTKHAMVGTFRQMVREKRGAIYSPILFGEMTTAQYERREGFEVTKITKPAGKFIDTVVCFAGALFTHRGSLEEPLLPLPESDIIETANLVARFRERDPELAERLAVDITGMTAAELDQVFEMRTARKKRGDSFSHGRHR